MWLFGKKKEKVEEAPLPDLQVQEFAQAFLAEEFDLVAVTGPNEVEYARKDDQALWTLTMSLTAWMDEDDGVVHTGPALLQTLADDQLRAYLSQYLPSDFIIKARVRPSKEGDVFQLVGMPEPGFDPELKAILTEQLTPVLLETEDLGTFTLNRSMNWFEQPLDWQGQPVMLCFDPDEHQQDSLDTARALLRGEQDWYSQLADFVVDRLLSTVNDLSQDGPVSREDFLASLVPDSVQTGPGGSFAVWYISDLLFGQTIRLMGTLAKGPADARLEEGKEEE